MARRIAVILVLGALAVGSLVAWLLPTREEALLSDLQVVASGSTDTKFINQYDFICFNFNVLDVREEFTQEARRLQKPFASSAESCGVSGSCCNPDSDASGYVGLARGSEIECMRITRFLFWTDGDRPICAAPTNLAVRHRPYTGPERHEGRAGIRTGGGIAFTIEERQP